MDYDLEAVLYMAYNFFRWLTNKDEEDESNWETPSFLQKIKSKKPLRDSPYEDSEIWERDAY